MVYIFCLPLCDLYDYKSETRMILHISMKISLYKLSRMHFARIHSYFTFKDELIHSSCVEMYYCTSLISRCTLDLLIGFQENSMYITIGIGNIRT
jgi:hypothetical protein